MSDLYLTPGQREVLGQLFLDGPTEDGNIACKISRGQLIEMGLARRLGGHTHLTDFGVNASLYHGLDKDKARRARRAAVRFFLGSDDSGHEFVVPVEYRAMWDAWVDQLNDDEPNCETPEFAYQVEGGLTFTWPVENGVAIVEELNVA
jgi:hypothetical protein